MNLFTIRGRQRLPKNILSPSALFSALHQDYLWRKTRQEFIKIQPVCQLCHRKDKLQVHHILPWHLYEHLRYDCENLVTLCESCHLRFGHYNNWKKYNPRIIELVETAQNLYIDYEQSYKYNKGTIIMSNPIKDLFKNIKRSIRKLLPWYKEPTTTTTTTTTPTPVTTPAPCIVTDRPPERMTNGFVWKAASESDHKLVVLLNRGYRKHVERVELVLGGTETIPEVILEVGRFNGDNHNGCRPHYRFSKKGGDYNTPDRALVVRVILLANSRASAQDPGYRLQFIPDGSKDLRI